jgi:Flp pilus assembly protein TadD
MARFIFTITIALLLCGCVHHTTVQDFGVIGQPPARRSSAAAPNVRSILQQQTRNVSNNAVSDSRIETLQSRVKTDPSDSAARLDLAVEYEGYRFYLDALDEYTAAFDLNRSEKAILGLARCSQAVNRAWRAIPLLEQFLQESPSASIWNALGLLYDADGDLASGERALRQAVGSEPSSDQWRNNLGYNLLLQNKIESAEIELRNALTLNPKSVTSHNNLGTLLARKGDLQAALEEFEFSADAPTALNNLAVVLMEMGNYEQSREQLVKALALRRNFAPALSNFKLVQGRMRQQPEPQKAGRISGTNASPIGRSSQPE